VTYDGATLVAAVAQTGQVVRTELSPGVSMASAVAALDVHTDQLQMYKLAYVAMLFVPPGVVLGLFGSTRRQRLRVGAVYLFSAAVLLEGALVIASGRAFDWANVGVATATGAIVLTLLAVALNNPEEHGHRRNLAWLPVQARFAIHAREAASRGTTSSAERPDGKWIDTTSIHGGREAGARFW
jgi:peptidoglycan/LPS O-acetylase OafA/YrhL